MGRRRLPGVSCGNNLVCRGGLCVTCTPGTPCSTNSDQCVEGGETVCGAASVVCKLDADAGPLVVRNRPGVHQRGNVHHV